MTHIDGTGRVQTVSKLFNEDFINLFGIFINYLMCQFYSIHHYQKLSTVMSPKNAIDCFLRTDMILVLNNYIIKR